MLLAEGLGLFVELPLVERSLQNYHYERQFVEIKSSGNSQAPSKVAQTKIHYY